jgi:hypothetical protein
MMDMMTDQGPKETGERPRLFPRTYRKRNPLRWIIALVIILVVMFLLPRLMDLLLPQ